MKYSILIIVYLIFSLNISSQTVTLDSCNFENICPILVIDTASTNLWEIGTPSKIIFDSAYSITNALITDSLNNYPTNSHSSFTLIPTDNYGGSVPNPNGYADNMRIEFKYKIDSDTLLDGGYIEVSYDYGQSWQNIVFDLVDHNLPIFDTLYNGEYGISGFNSEWQSGYLEWIWTLPVKAQTIDTLMVRFNFVSDAVETNKEGWMIDDLRVSYQNFFSDISNTEKGKILTYPSPTQSLINVELKDITNFQNASIQLIDNLGKVVLNQTILQQKSQLSIDHLPQGFYHVLFIQNNTIIGQSKVIKE